ncbi:MAG: helix-turn-helix domain-containing protein [Gemmatimonadota bacterium]|nr:helix-turn-helix domain-containing protein [Gemmatimonadota bacterium]
MVGGVKADDPLMTLREYRHLAPWSLRDLASLAAAILDVTGTRPINAAASARPSERTIRFYVTRRLVTPPNGRGTAAIYSYRHLLEVLAIKLRQMEGATLTSIATELDAMTGDVLERRVAAALGVELPAPTALPFFERASQPRGRAGQVLRSAVGHAEPDATDPPSDWHRLRVADGVELHVRGDHPLPDTAELRRHMADAVRLAVDRVLAAHRSSSEGTRGPEQASDDQNRV